MTTTTGASRAQRRAALAEAEKTSDVVVGRVRRMMAWALVAMLGIVAVTGAASAYLIYCFNELPVLEGPEVALTPADLDLYQLKGAKLTTYAAARLPAAICSVIMVEHQGVKFRCSAGFGADRACAPSYTCRPDRPEAE